MVHDLLLKVNDVASIFHNQRLLKKLDHLPGDKRTKIGFITYDGNIHFYKMADGASQPTMLVVSDIDGRFIGEVIHKFYMHIHMYVLYDICIWCVLIQPNLTQGAAMYLSIPLHPKYDDAALALISA